MSAIMSAIEIESTFNEETGEIEFTINCPEDDLFTPSAFGSADSVLEDIALKITEASVEIGLDLEDVRAESFIDPRVLEEREELKRILKK